MSLRPRFGDGGQVRRPLMLRGEPTDGREHTDVRGMFADDQDWDPFVRIEETDLLLAEDFARMDLDSWETVTRWCFSRGVLDLIHTFPADHWEPTAPEGPGLEFQDPPAAIRGQQRQVAWILLTLARLSLGEEVFEPRWMEVSIRGTEGIIRLRTCPENHIHAERLPADAKPDRGPDEIELFAPAEAWRERWLPLVKDEDVAAWAGYVGLTLGHSGLVELVRRLLEPYVRVAAQSDVELLWPDAEYPLLVSERRRWRSVLAPIALQLLEGLRRVTDGQRGAAFCRECGQPFLTLDARRSSFCNDKERFRNAQRERRKRVDRERSAREAVARLPPPRPSPEEWFREHRTDSATPDEPEE